MQLANLPSESITTWDQLMQVFLHKYFSPHKIAKFHNEITTFKQNGSEQSMWLEIDSRNSKGNAHIMACQIG